MNVTNVNNLIDQLKSIQTDFLATFGVTDIITNSKIFEILIADSLGHFLIPGHSGSRDAKDSNENEFEYKHYKESSSNHSWTFNDFSDATVKNLKNTKAVIFAHIQDTTSPPIFDWCYEVPGPAISHYLTIATRKIKNNRKMINVSPKQIEKYLGLTKQMANRSPGRYYSWIKRIIDVAERIENEVGTTGILTSNKFWEVLVALKLGHKVQSEQSDHDAVDEAGNFYEYKVAKGSSWSFQDISDIVLRKYLSDRSIILASVDKDGFVVKKIYNADTKRVVNLLRKKLREKKRRYFLLGKEIRRKQISLSIKDLRDIRAKLAYSED